MPLRTEVIAFQDARADLQGQMEALADDLADKQDAINARQSEGRKTDHLERQAQELTVQGNELNNQQNILRDIEAGEVATVEAFDAVELAGLTAGEINLVEDTVEQMPKVRERDAWVALGTRDAPYVAHDPNHPAADVDAYHETVANVADLPLAYVRWAEGKISELSHLSETEGNGFLQLAQERRSKELSGEANG